MGKTISISTFDEFKVLFRNKHKNSIVTESPNIPANTYAYSNNFNALHINNQSTSESLSIFTDEIGIVNPGDIIDINSEVMNISGEKVKIGIDAYTIEGQRFGSKIKQMAELQSKKTGEFESLSGKFIVDQTCYLRIFIGVWTADIGEYYLRNINIKSNSNHYIKNTKPITKKYTVRKIGGAWEIRDDFASDVGTISVLDNITLELTYDEPFNIRPVALLGGEYYNGAFRHRPVTSYATEDYVRIRFISKDAIEDVLDNLNDGYHFNLILMGY